MARKFKTLVEKYIQFFKWKQSQSLKRLKTHCRTISLINNRMGAVSLRMGTSRVGYKVWDWWVGSIQDPWYGWLRMGWPLGARRSLFPDWPWLCDESSPHKRALCIPVQILAGKFKMKFLPTTSLSKAFPVAQICPNLHKIVPSSMRCWKQFYAILDASVLQGMLL